jgi:hypothetical protein
MKGIDSSAPTAGTIPLILGYLCSYLSAIYPPIKDDEVPPTITTQAFIIEY